MKISDLFETPKMISPTSFNMYDVRVNHRFARRLLSKNNKRIIFSLDDDIHLYEFSSAYALIDIKKLEVLYYVKYKFLKKSFLPKPAAQQISVWRNRRKLKTSNIASKIFFDFLLPKTGIVVTDAEQTEDGQAFWFNRIGDAFNKGLYVYFIDIMAPRKIKRIFDEDELYDIVKDANIWGSEQKHTTRRIAISDTIFPTGARGEQGVL